MADTLEATIDNMGGQATENTIDPEVLQRRQYNRREFMVYSFLGGTGLFLGGVGYASFEFLYPRFKAGTFGGDFLVSADTLPSHDADPQGDPDGKFWLVETAEGETKAIYMVCTHLGCLYKWIPSNWRFECPCHGSKFDHDGMYIEGPAGRSLDYFAIEDKGDGTIAVKTGSKQLGSPASESPAKVAI